MREPDNEKGFSLDENGKLNDLEEAKWVVHELSTMMLKITEDPLIFMRLGPQGLFLVMFLASIHAMVCDVDIKKEPEPKKSSGGGLGAVNIPGLDLDELFKNFK